METTLSQEQLESAKTVIAKSGETQRELIQIYNRIKVQSKDRYSHPILEGHYAHVLFGLHRLIESYGPSPQYYEWLKLIAST
jgi:hypothetical protein